MEEVQTLDINMDEGMHNDESTVISTIETSTIDTTIIETSTIETSTTLTPPSSPITTSVPVSNISPTFFGIMQEPITTLFSSQSTEKSQPQPKADDDDDDVMVYFTELQFDREEDNIPDEMIMLGRQFKILNSKINSIL